MTKFDIGFKCDGNCEECSGASATFCPGTAEVFSPDEEGYYDYNDLELYNDGE